jgi:hypothetical protein
MICISRQISRSVLVSRSCTTSLGNSQFRHCSSRPRPSLRDSRRVSRCRQGPVGRLGGQCHRRRPDERALHRSCQAACDRPRRHFLQGERSAQYRPQPAGPPRCAASRRIRCRPDARRTHRGRRVFGRAGHRGSQGGLCIAEEAPAGVWPQGGGRHRAA